jgi:hypothetical protein
MPKKTFVRPASAKPRDVSKKIMILALLITISLFLSMMIIGSIFNNSRQTRIDQEFQRTYSDIDNLQKIMLISETFNPEVTCRALKIKLQELDEHLWDTGIKLEQYRIASEEFKRSEYYRDQKRYFNDDEFTYLILLTQIKNKCNYTQPIITFFYQNSEDCKKCDDQSFVLTDVKKELENNVSIFSFDADLNLSTVNLLRDSYSVNELPCIIIEGNTHCGIRDKDFIMMRICEYLSNETPQCREY